MIDAFTDDIFKPLSNIDILEYSKNKNIKIYCVAKDELKKHKLLKNNEAIVCNLDDLQGPGTHWICILYKDRRIFYYDPFGIQHIDPEIADYIKRHKGTYYTSTEQNQEMTSNKCGWFCLSCINSCLGHRQMSYQQYMDILFDSPDKYNELIIFCLI